MAETFQARVLNNIADTISTGDFALSATMMDTFCADGAKEILAQLPVPLIRSSVQYGTASTSNPLTVTEERVVDVLREDGTDGQWRRAIEINETLQTEASDANSYYYATKYSPKYYRLNGSVYVLPAPTAGGTDSAKVATVTYPTIDADTDTTIGNFPDEMEPTVVDYATMRALHRAANKAQRTVYDEIEAITVSGYLSDFEGAIPTYSAPATLTLSSMGTLPTVSLGSLGTFPTFSLTETIPTYSSPASFNWSSVTIDDALTKAENLVDNLGTTDFESYLDDDDVELAQSALQGAQQEVSRAATAVNAQIGELNEFRAETTEAVNDFQSTLSGYQSEVQKEIQQYQTDIDKVFKEYSNVASIDLKEYQSKTSQTIQEYQALITSEIQSYQAKIQSEVSEFQSNVAIARAYLEEGALRLKTANAYAQIGQQAYKQAEGFEQRYEKQIKRYAQGVVSG